MRFAKPGSGTKVDGSPSRDTARRAVFVGDRGHGRGAHSPALDDEETHVARRVVLRMVELRHDAEDARRWASGKELVEVAPAARGGRGRHAHRARLLVVDGDQITT